MWPVTDCTVRPKGSRSANNTAPNRHGEGNTRMGSLLEESHLDDRRTILPATVRRIALPNRPCHRLGSREHLPPYPQQVGLMRGRAFRAGCHIGVPRPIGRGAPVFFRLGTPGALAV
jgi:hypothetical protein